MIDQLLIYFFCYLLGWVPLYYGYRFLENNLPFRLETGVAKFGVFPFIKLAYIGAEIARAYFLMEIVHQWLVFDWDLFIGVGLFLLAVFWPIGCPKQFRTAFWLPIIGIYGFLLPYVSWVAPLIIFVLTVLTVGPYYRSIVLGVFFLAVGAFFTDLNSLYVAFYAFMMVFILAKTYSLNSAKVSSDNESLLIRS
jgi:hypothetical protein